MDSDCCVRVLSSDCGLIGGLGWIHWCPMSGEVVVSNEVGDLRSGRGKVAAGCFFIFVAGHLLWSSPEYRMLHLLLACLAALIALGAHAWPLFRRCGWRCGVLAAGLVLAHLAAWLGGVGDGTPPVQATWMAAGGLLGVAGIAVWCVWFVGKPVPSWLSQTGLAVVVLLLVSSLAGYLLVIERFIPLGGEPGWFDRIRMPAIWPTRLLTAGMGQIAWQNTNVAGYGFALALALVLETMARSRGGRMGWFLCAALVAAVYLTASRGAGLMLLLALPIVLIGRPPRFTLATLLVLLVGVVAGHAMLKTKHARLIQLASEASITGGATTQAVPKTAAHNRNYIKRADSGRLRVYQGLWEEGAESRWFGCGLAVAGTDAMYLNHEHSSFLATFRCGGLVAVAGHLMVLATAAWCAWMLLRDGVRWPAVLLVAALGGLLFDRSSVLPLTGFVEFPAHWLAVLLPVLRSCVMAPAGGSAAAIEPPVVSHHGFT